MCLLEEKVFWVQLLFRCMHATYSTYFMKKKYQRKAVGTIVLKSGAGDRKDLFMCLGQQNQGKKNLNHQTATVFGASSASET